MRRGKRGELDGRAGEESAEAKLESEKRDVPPNETRLMLFTGCILSLVIEANDISVLISIEMLRLPPLVRDTWR